MEYNIVINTGDLENTLENYVFVNNLQRDPDDLWFYKNLK
jgi:hypothetical protein